MFYKFYFLFSFSRKIIWLQASITNKRPEVVADFFLKAVDNIKGWCNFNLYLLCPHTIGGGIQFTLFHLYIHPEVGLYSLTSVASAKLNNNDFKFYSSGVMVLE